MPEPPTSGNIVDIPASSGDTTAEIYLQEETEQAGAVDTDLALQSEQRAMQELHRFQKLPLQALDQPDAPLPNAPPTYAMLPKEWPLARMSVLTRHVSVLLRGTLLRHLAELSFQGVAFTELPREVVRDVRRDFDGVCGAVADQLASLFVFLKPDQPESAHSDPLSLRRTRTEGAGAAPVQESEEGEAEDETYLVPVGQVCFSFQRGLVHRAAQTYAIRSVDNKYELISKWLLTGLAVTMSIGIYSREIEHVL